MTKLHIKNLSKTFNSITAVDQVSIELYSNKIYGLLGPNGSGKTTLFNCISGIYKPTHGQIIFNEQPIHGLSPYHIANLGIRRTFQTIRLAQELKVAENIYIGYFTQSQQNLWQSFFKGKNYHIDEQQAWAQVNHVAAQLNLQPYLHHQTSTLAYGLQRKVEIARAIIANPSVLILDEPAAGMNETEKIDLTNTIKLLQRPDLIILLIEHDMHMVKSLCQELCVLHHGKLIASGTTQDIQNNPAVIEAYLGTNNYAKN